MGKLTNGALPRLVKKPGRHLDGGGMFFRVLDHNKAYFTYRYRIGGKEREMSLGPYPETTLDQARATHAAMRAKVKSSGIDPLAEKRAARVTTPSTTVPTFGQIADQYVATHEASWKNEKHGWQWRQSVGVYSAAIRNMPVDQIDTAAVLRTLQPLWNTVPETAARTRGRIEQVIAAAQALGHIPADRANPARWKGHLNKLLPDPKKIGHRRGPHRALSYEDAPEFVQRLRKIKTSCALALEFIILTCTRAGETLNATWREFDIEAAKWTIPAVRTKTGKEHVAPLSKRAVAILAEALKLAKKEPQPASYVFPGGLPKQPLSNMGLTMLMRRMGVDATTHGFRSSARSWMGDTGVDFEVAENCLGHLVGNTVTRAYLRTSMVERQRPVLEAWAQFLEGEDAAKVVPITAGKKRR
jgi:integrase